MRRGEGALVADDENLSRLPRDEIVATSTIRFVNELLRLGFSPSEIQ